MRDFGVKLNGLYGKGTFMLKKIYTAAIIGTGRIGFTLGFDKKREQPASHTMALKKNRRIRLIAGCDSDFPSLEKWHKANRKSQIYSESSQLFACIKPDIVVVSVNESAHLEVSLEAIRAKPKLVILEKPVALNSVQGMKILEESDLYGVPILVNHERRFARDYRFAKKCIDEIGTLMTVNARLDSGLRVYSPSCEDDGEYSLLHDGTHLVDIVQYLLEPYGFQNFHESGTADGTKKSFQKILRDMRVTNIVYDEKEDGVVRNLSVNYESDLCPDVNISISGRSRFFGFEVDIIGTEGRIRIGNGFFEFYRAEESKLYSGFRSLTKDEKVRPPSRTLYFSNMVQNAVDFLDGTSPLYSTIETGLSALSLLEEIKEAL